MRKEGEVPHPPVFALSTVLDQESNLSPLARARAPDQTKLLESLLQQLPERERTVLQLHFGLSGPKQTLHQIGGLLGISHERVRQIEEVAIKRLRGLGNQPCDQGGSGPRVIRH
jgi:RNA polymerase primary sigma factor